MLFTSRIGGIKLPALSIDPNDIHLSRAILDVNGISRVPVSLSAVYYTPARGESMGSSELFSDRDNERPRRTRAAAVRPEKRSRRRGRRRRRRRRWQLRPDNEYRFPSLRLCNRYLATFMLNSRSGGLGRDYSKKNCPSYEVTAYGALWKSSFSRQLLVLYRRA